MITLSCMSGEAVTMMIPLASLSIEPPLAPS